MAIKKYKSTLKQRINDRRRFKIKYIKDPKKYIDKSSNWQKLNPIKYYFGRYRKSAEERNIKFNLTIKNFTNFLGLNCYYCNEKINVIGLDRKNNNIGYTIRNVVPCCKKCNFMKGKLSELEFIDKCQKITINKIQLTNL